MIAPGVEVVDGATATVIADGRGILEPMEYLLVVEALSPSTECI